MEKLHDCWCVTKREPFEWTGSCSWMVHAVHILPKTDMESIQCMRIRFWSSKAIYTTSETFSRHLHKLHSHLQYRNFKFASENLQESRSTMYTLVFLNSFLTQKLWCSANTFLYLDTCGFLSFKWQVLYICFVLKEIFANSEMEWWLSGLTSLIMSRFGNKATYWNGHRDFHRGPKGLCASSPVGTSCGCSSFHFNHPKLLTSNWNAVCGG